MLQFDVCCKATNQNFDCGCDHCAILRLDSLHLVHPCMFGAMDSSGSGTFYSRSIPRQLVE